MAGSYVDADGHVMVDIPSMLELLDEPFRDPARGRSVAQLLPSLDNFHTPSDGTPQPVGAFDFSTGVERWLEFLNRTGIEKTVLFPTPGLAYGRIAYPKWALAWARAYNTWLAKNYLEASPRFQAVALIPFQDVPAAVAELRRAVTELGMLGAMIPSNGLHRHVTHQEFWPIYEEAERLDCVLAVHGGCYGDLGFNSFTVLPATRALGMPFPLAIAMTGLIVDGVLDRFPRLRVALLEGGTAWIPLVIDRLERELEYGGLKLPRHPVEYFQDDRVFVACEGN
jgi:predicted TIM-barrel fold metal-dependent hydrolase